MKVLITSLVGLIYDLIVMHISSSWCCATLGQSNTSQLLVNILLIQTTKVQKLLNWQLFTKQTLKA